LQLKRVELSMTVSSAAARRRWPSFGLALATCIAQVRSAGSADFDAELEVSGYADTDHVEVLTPAVSGTLSDARSGVSATGGYVVDIVSGASVDIVSTASERWTEVRQAADLSVDHKPEDLGLTLSGSVSREPDYLSWSLGATARIELDADHVTPSLGYSFSHDTAGRRGTPYSIYALRLVRHTAQAGVELVLNRSSRLVLLGEAAFESGRQEKPYRFLPLFDAETAALIGPGESIESVNALRLPGRIAERVPDTRRRFTLTGDWARRGARHTLRVNERLYADSWGLYASTSDLSWLWDLSSGLTLGPRARFHVQSSVDFWQRAYVADLGSGELSVPALRSGDRELSALWTGSLGLGSEWRTHETYSEGWAFGALVELGITRFLDALFIEQRSSALVVLTVERAF
jgi:hypothetical protein